MLKAKRERIPAVTAISPARSDGVLLWRCHNQNTDLMSWLDFHAAEVRSAVHTCGAFCLRGFAPLESAALAAVAGLLTGESAAYRECTTPRSLVGPGADHVYTSTEYPADQHIFLHNENAYAPCWPAFIYFYCREVARDAGQTCLADLVKVEACIDPEVRRRIAARGLMHRRTFVAGIGLPWQTAFATPDRQSLYLHCAQHGYEVDEHDAVLRVNYRHGAQVLTPVTRQVRWFNHAAFFQPESLDSATRSALGDLAAIPALPNQMLYGDGAPLEPEVVAQLRNAYRAAEIQHCWQQGDLLILDNMRFAHGRRPFEGRRLIWTVLSGTLWREDLTL